MRASFVCGQLYYIKQYASFQPDRWPDEKKPALMGRAGFLKRKKKRNAVGSAPQ
jgi:hypothetical protein